MRIRVDADERRMKRDPSSGTRRPFQSRKIQL
jgi:hypothetical protein